MKTQVNKHRGAQGYGLFYLHMKTQVNKHRGAQSMGYSTYT